MIKIGERTIRYAPRFHVPRIDVQEVPRPIHPPEESRTLGIPTDYLRIVDLDAPPIPPTTPTEYDSDWEFAQAFQCEPGDHFNWQIFDTALLAIVEKDAWAFLPFECRYELRMNIPSDFASEQRIAWYRRPDFDLEYAWRESDMFVPDVISGTLRMRRRAKLLRPLAS